MSAIFDNAIDSLKMSLRHHADDDLPTKDKWAILSLFHCIELLLKERLYREHPILILDNIDQYRRQVYTVSFGKMLERFKNLNVNLKDWNKTIKWIQDRRNEIEHYEYSSHPADENELGRCLQFIRYFIESHLEEDIVDLLTPDLQAEVSELIVSYDELAERARASVKFEVEKSSWGGDGDEAESGWCPECNDETLLLVPGEPSRCFLCKDKFRLSRCDYCSSRFSGEFNDLNICDDCFSYRAERD